MRRFYMQSLIALVAALCLAVPDVSPNPAILFCSPAGATYGWLDLTYLTELHKNGFEVDYTRSCPMSPLTGCRITTC